MPDSTAQALVCFVAGKLVVYDLPTLHHPTNDGIVEIALNAPDLNNEDVKSDACCFTGTDSDLVISGSDDGKLYIWSLPWAE